MLFKGNYKDYLNYDGFKTHVIGTEVKFLYWPRKCYISGKWLIFKEAYKQTAMWTGPGDPVFEYRYYNKSEFLIEKIKGQI